MRVLHSVVSLWFCLLSVSMVCYVDGAKTTGATASSMTIGSPPNVTAITGAFNFTEVDRITSTSPDGSLSTGAIMLNITRSAGPSDVIYSSVGPFNFSQLGYAVTAVGPTTSTGGTFQLANIGGVAANTLTGTYTGALIMDPNASYKVNLGQISWGTGLYEGASGPILFNTSRVTTPAAVSDASFTAGGTTTFLASLQTTYVV